MWNMKFGAHGSPKAWGRKGYTRGPSGASTLWTVSACGSWGGGGQESTSSPHVGPAIDVSPRLPMRAHTHRVLVHMGVLALTYRGKLRAREGPRLARGHKGISGGPCHTSLVGASPTL